MNVPALIGGWGGHEKQGSSKVLKTTEMKKPGVIGKGGGEVSGGGIGLLAGKNHAGDKILLSSTGDGPDNVKEHAGCKKLFLLLPEGLEWAMHMMVTF